MSAYCERCGREWKHIPDGHSAPGFACKTCNPPRKVPCKVPLRYYIRSYVSGIPELLDEFVIWLNYGTSYWRYPAWWALICPRCLGGLRAHSSAKHGNGRQIRKPTRLMPSPVPRSF